MGLLSSTIFINFTLAYDSSLQVFLCNKKLVLQALYLITTGEGTKHDQQTATKLLFVNNSLILVWSKLGK